MIRLANEIMETICSYMDDDIREELHNDNLTNERFLVEYCKLDHELETILWNEFKIDIDDLAAEVER